MAINSGLSFTEGPEIRYSFDPQSALALAEELSRILDLDEDRSEAESVEP